MKPTLTLRALELLLELYTKPQEPIGTWRLETCSEADSRAYEALLVHKLIAEQLGHYYVTYAGMEKLQNLLKLLNSEEDS